MNERLKQLAINSQLVSEHKGKLLSCWREDVDLTEYLEDFAELIVEEACRALNPMLRDQISRGQGVDLIKERFELNRYTQEELDEAHRRGVQLANKLRVE